MNGRGLCSGCGLPIHQGKCEAHFRTEHQKQDRKSKENISKYNRQDYERKKYTYNGRDNDDMSIGYEEEKEMENRDLAEGYGWDGLEH